MSNTVDTDVENYTPEELFTILIIIVFNIK